jgi:hypothetical protein
MEDKKPKSAFEILSAVDCTDKIEQKNGLSYLSWAWAWGELKKRYPRSFYTIYEAQDGMIFFTDRSTCWVKTGVTLVEEGQEPLEHIEYLPIMNNRNQSIKLEAIESTDVNKAIQRSLTKAIARHGLGLYIYAGEDLPETPCEACGETITSFVGSNGKLTTVSDIVKMTKSKYGKALCTTCGAKAKAAALAPNKKEDKQSE